MALSDDQKALLRLLAQREEGYADIAALMGLSVPEVRSRVKGALEELDEELDEGRSAAGPVAAGDPPPPPVAKASSGAVPPATPPAEEAPRARPAGRPAPSRPREHPVSPRSRLFVLPESPRRLAEIAGGALVVLLLVLFATGAIDLGGDSDSEGGDGGAATEVAAGSSQLTQAELEPVDGGDASGRALFGRVGRNPVLQVQADGLEPSGAGQSYTVWLYRSPKLALRVGAVKVGESGGLAAQLPIPLELLGFVANGAFTKIRVSLTENAAYRAEVARAKRQDRLPGYSGDTVLEGEIVGPAAATE